MNKDELRKAFAESLQKQTTDKTTNTRVEVENKNLYISFNYVEEYFYQGEKLNGLPHGKGVCIDSDGDIYAGDWKNGVPQGKGSVTYKDGGCYYGNWENGVAEGRGVFTYEDCTCICGEYKNGRECSVRTVIYEDGGCSCGEFNTNNILIKGTIIYADGAIFSGEFDPQEGTQIKGMEAYEDGCQYGSFCEGQLIKGIRIHYEDEKTETPAGCECGEFIPNEGLLKGTRSYLDIGYCTCGEYNSDGDLLKGIHAWDDGNYEIEKGYR